MADASRQEIKLFYCYAHEDKALRDELQINLAGLRRQHHLINWYDREILPGDKWEEAIEKHLSTADVILLLISPHFVDSDYCYSKEMQRALERHHAGNCCVIPILLRPIYWKDTPLKSIQMLPANARPITSWPDRYEAFHDVARGIDAAIKALLHFNKSKSKRLAKSNMLSSLQGELFDAHKIDAEILRVVGHLGAKGQPPTIRDLSRYLTKIDVGHLKIGVANLVCAGELSENKSGRSPRYTTIKDVQTSLKTKEKWLEKGEALHGLKRYEEALTVFEHLINLDPNFVDAYDGEGSTLQKLGKIEEAEKAFEKARQIGYTN